MNILIDKLEITSIKNVDTYFKFLSKCFRESLRKLNSVKTARLWDIRFEPWYLPHTKQKHK
jgi:hypothetical protein